MIHLGLSVQNPWSERFSAVKNWTGSSIVKDYFWEIEILRTNDVVGIGFGLTYGVIGQHNNLHVCLALLGWSISTSFYNSNHH